MAILAFMTGISWHISSFQNLRWEQLFPPAYHQDYQQYSLLAAADLLGCSFEFDIQKVICVADFEAPAT